MNFIEKFLHRLGVLTIGILLLASGIGIFLISVYLFSFSPWFVLLYIPLAVIMSIIEEF